MSVRGVVIASAMTLVVYLQSNEGRPIARTLMEAGHEVKSCVTVTNHVAAAGATIWLIAMFPVLTISQTVQLVSAVGTCVSPGICDYH